MCKRVYDIRGFGGDSKVGVWYEWVVEIDNLLSGVPTEMVYGVR